MISALSFITDQYQSLNIGIPAISSSSHQKSKIKNRQSSFKIHPRPARPAPLNRLPFPSKIQHQKSKISNSPPSSASPNAIPKTFSHDFPALYFTTDQYQCLIFGTPARGAGHGP